tara:strand:- start:1799 stop:1987 length:189 start_codon:yes stop_codon:yes gene_type:complete
MGQFYKKYILDNEEESWGTGSRIFFTDGEVLSENNRISRDDWVWYDTPPEEYTQWLEDNGIF